MDSLTLRCGATECRLAPQLGGALLSLQVGKESILRSAPSEVASVLETACFPLVPFANRIANGRFTFRGHRISLPPDPIAAPDAHHGHGWRRPWTVAQLGADRAKLTLLHETSDWPWRYQATQSLRVFHSGLFAMLTVRNLDARPMPAGVGFHPYFPRAVGPQQTGQRGLQDLITPAGAMSVAALEGMDAFTPMIAKGVSLRTSMRQTDVRMSGAAGLHIYVPSGADFFCVEPVSHPPNAIQDERNMIVLGQGAAVRMSIRLTSTEI